MTIELISVLDEISRFHYFTEWKSLNKNQIDLAEIILNIKQKIQSSNQTLDKKLYDLLIEELKFNKKGFISGTIYIIIVI